MIRRLFLIASVVLASAASLASQTAELTIVNAGPNGELQELPQALEIRIVFSEPMVPLGRVPSNPTPAWVHITPSIPGVFRWSGTSTLLFNPEQSTLPFGTKYQVTVDAGAESVAGRRLRAPYTLTFTTPTVRLRGITWARRNDRATDPVTVALMFNQPVRANDVLAHLVARFSAHEPRVPEMTSAERARLLASDPEGIRQFDAKVAEARRTASRTDVVAMRVATEWDSKKFSAKPDRAILETSSPVPPGTQLEFAIDARMPGLQGPETFGAVQRTVAPMEPVFFANGIRCREECTSSDYNAIEFSVPVHTAPFAAALSARDISTAGRETAVAKTAPVKSAPRDASMYHGVEDGGFDRQPPDRTWALRLDPSLQSQDGQTLGYPATFIVQNWNERAFVSFGDGYGVWESSSGPQLPFYSRNFQTITEYVVPISPADLMPRLLALERNDFRGTPSGSGVVRRLPVTPNQIQSYGLDLRRAGTAGTTGLFWAGLAPGDSIARSKPVPRDKSTLVQVTNLGISVKDSPQSTLIFVARLDNGEAVADAAVSIVDTKNTVLWRGTTGRDGVAMAPALPLRGSQGYWDVAFVVLAQKNDDVAYVVSNWNEGIEPWDFRVDFDRSDGAGYLRGSVFTDRGVYKPGETVQFKAIVRADSAAGGIRLLPAGSTLDVRLLDTRSNEVDKRTVTINRWSSAEWSWTIPASGTLGHYQIAVSVPGSTRPARNDAVEYEPDSSWQQRVNGSFLVAAYRRPDFSVDVKLASADDLAGAVLSGSVTGRYLFGGSMAKRPVKWTMTREPALDEIPAAIRERFPIEQYQFGYYPDARERATRTVAGAEAVLDAAGHFAASIPTDRALDLPYRYTFETDIEDISRQHIANRASVVLHPASVYLGVGRTDQFATTDKGGDVDIVAVDFEGKPVAGLNVSATLVRWQWNSVRHAEGSGFYEWESERIEIPSGQWTIRTSDKPVPLHFEVPEGGSYVLRVTTRDRNGRTARTDHSFYASGSGYTAWERYDHNRITLEPEHKSWKPGQTARILIKSPWERATALMTIEREGVRSYKRFTLASTQQTIDVPLTAQDIPNVFVSVLLIRGRTSADPGTDGSDPGKPAFRLGYTELLVVDDTKRLDLKVSADRDEYRPANTAKVSVAVSDSNGKASASEVTLWAVDRGVLALTDYAAPDVASAIYVRKGLQVMNEDSRQRIISRRVLTPKGADEGGGGGEVTARTDFRPLAFWLGSVETDARGRATREVTLPESLTTYTILAVAGDTASRFGSGTASIRVSKPITLLPLLPRFLALSDRASFGALVSNTQKNAADAIVTIQSLDPSRLEFQGVTESRQRLSAGATTAVRFDAIARGVGNARVRVTVTAGTNTDAFEMTLPVGAPARMETTAAFGDTADRAVERLAVPAGVLASAGGLSIDMASSALVGLGEGARYLADYPFFCAEQKSSAALALALAADLGSAFSMGNIAPADYRARATALLEELPKYQCADGGFGYWPERCRYGNFYLTSYVLHVLRVASGVGLARPAIDEPGAIAFLETELKANPPDLPQWLPAWTASASYAVRELTARHVNQDGNITRLASRLNAFPIFALSYLADAMVSPTGARHPQYADVIRRLMNAVRVEGDRAHVEELDDDALLWLWNSNVRSTAVVLEGLSRRRDDAQLIPALVRGLLGERRNGRWRNTQENAMALEALVGYYKVFEATEPNFSATVTLGADTIGSAAFRGRSSASQSVRLAMPDLLRQVASGTETDLALSRAGTGRLYYAARLQFVPSAPLPPSDQGIHVERQYARLSDAGDGPPATTFAAGDLIRVTLTITLPKERRYVAVSDPLAAGFEAVDSWFRTTAADLAKDASSQPSDGSFFTWWQRGGFDYVEKYDDRVALFATRLSQGRHEFSYIVRATTAGTFSAPGTWAEEMYAPEVNGRSAPATVVIK
ncbi:MAG TPA: MG2 domain-containing protein [Vicinamibacterales bacterium]|nr:MG2 domain-containing protein [Vicinamibacterales bacterium]